MFEHYGEVSVIKVDLCTNLMIHQTTNNIRCRKKFNIRKKWEYYGKENWNQTYELGLFPYKTENDFVSENSI